MATKGKSPGRKAQSRKFEFKGFHNVTPTEEDISDFIAFGEGDSGDVEDRLVVLAEEGWKCSFSFDTWRDSYCFSATAKRVRDDLDGYCFTFYHRDSRRGILFGSWYLRRMIDGEQLFVPKEKDSYDW